MFKALKSIAGGSVSMQIELTDAFDTAKDGNPSIAVPLDADHISGVVHLNNSTAKIVIITKLLIALSVGQGYLNAAAAGMIQGDKTSKALPTGSFHRRPIHKVEHILVPDVKQVPPGVSSFPFILPINPAVPPSFKGVESDNSSEICYRLVGAMWKTSLEPSLTKELILNVRRSVPWSKPEDRYFHGTNRDSKELPYTYYVGIPDPVYSSAEFFNVTLSFDSTPGLNINIMNAELAFIETYSQGNRTDSKFKVTEKKITSRPIKAQEIDAESRKAIRPHTENFLGPVLFTVFLNVGETLHHDFSSPEANGLVIQHHVQISVGSKFSVAIPVRILVAQVGSTRTASIDASNIRSIVTPGSASTVPGVPRASMDSQRAPRSSVDVQRNTVSSLPGVSSPGPAYRTAYQSSPALSPYQGYGGATGAGYVTGAAQQAPSIRSISVADKDRGANGQTMDWEVIRVYQPIEVDELPLAPGDFVTIEQPFEDHWALGTHLGSGRQGFFPLCILSGFDGSVQNRTSSRIATAQSTALAYAQLQQKLPQQQQQPQPQQPFVQNYQDDLALSMQHVQIANAPPSMPPPSVISTSTGHVDFGNLPRYTVVKPYNPQLPDELTMIVGNTVVVAHNFGDGWAKGTNMSIGQSGVFPLNCLGPEQLVLSSGYPTSEVSYQSGASQIPMVMNPSQGADPNTIKGYTDDVSITSPVPASDGNFRNSQDVSGSDPNALGGEPQRGRRGSKSNTINSTHSRGDSNPQPNQSQSQSQSNPASPSLSHVTASTVPVANSLEELDELLVEEKINGAEYIRQRSRLAALAELDAKLMAGEIAGPEYIQKRNALMKKK
ncbi:uncharacterized protein BJ171DRAFT_476229 [Polychytrium aggregatum]|uniref:uncharacterized protein n=1 Tax=Polychytrium aggregatum TaxID=110093 RepID=UPI0022FEC342|nr:uncharacterized protein BJ171DRAFT_476229 [Polychytrium aggregatum]KAI9203010.1 hypothetical protein BJ171DRAFT_476229 [Polychytrium aggregatum]